MDRIALPLIMDKIFGLLEPRDVYHCKLACPAWREEASYWLARRYPTIKAYSSVTIVMKKRDIRSGRPKMPGLYFHLKNGDEFQYLPRRDLRRSFGSFLSDLESDNLLTLGTFGYQLESLITPYLLSANQVSLMIEQKQMDFSLDLASKILGFTSKKNIPDLMRKPPIFDSCVSKGFDGLNLHRWTTDTKIILTDWDMEESIGGNLDDPNFPIKSLIHLNVVPFFIHTIENFLKDKNIAVSGVLLNERSKLLIKELKSDSQQAQNPVKQSVSIAFAGENVRAAIISIENLLESEHPVAKLITFKESLDFPVDDGRVIGFLFNGCQPSELDARNEILFSIQQIFPHINFLDILCSDPYKGNEPELYHVKGIRIHLVYI